VVVPHFDALEIGHTEELGHHVFSPDEIVRFARAFDPQPFHVDEAAGRASPFGGLVASGWHTAAAWMKALVAHRAAAMAHAAETGIAPPRYGSSPGFKNLRWLKPVRAGDTIRYATTLTDKRVSASRPGWGLTFSRNTGHNQRGELVFSFDGCGFVARDPG
jgi:acyl dehydratase